MVRTIQFEIDDELEGHLVALAADWDKDPHELAKALFKEELLGQTSGSRGVPFLRRYLYRNSDAYFTPEEKAARDRKVEALATTPEGKALAEQQKQALESLDAAVAKRNSA